MFDGELIRIVSAHNCDTGQHPITEFRDLKNEKGENGQDKYIDYIDIVVSLLVTTGGANTCPARQMFQWLTGITVQLHGQSQPYVNAMDGWGLRHLYRDRFGRVAFTDPATVAISQTNAARTMVIRIPFKDIIGEKGQDAKVHPTAIKSVRISRDDTVLSGGTDITSALADINVKLADYHKTVVPVAVTLEQVAITDLRRVDVEESDKLHYLAILPKDGTITDTIAVDLFDSTGRQLCDEITLRELNRMANMDCILDAASIVDEAGAADVARLLWEPLSTEGRRWTKAKANPTGFIAKLSAVVEAGDTFIAVRSWARPAKSREGRKYLRHGRGIANPERVTVVSKNTARKSQPRSTIQTAGIPDVVESR